MKKIFFTVIFLTALISAKASVTIPDTAIHKYRYGISARLNSLLAGGIAFDAFISPRINLEASGSIFLTIGGEAGLNYHFFKKPLDLRIGNWSPYTGIHTGYYELHFLTRTNYAAIYIPVGIQHLDKSRLSLAFDIGYSMQRIEDYHQGDYEPYRTYIDYLPMGRFKIGYRW